MMPKNKIIIAVCAVAVVIFGGLYASNAGLLKGNSFSISTTTESNPTISPNRPSVTEAYCKKLKAKVDNLEVRGLGVTATLTAAEYNNLNACTGLLGKTMIDGLSIAECTALQSRLNALFAETENITDNISTLDATLTSLCNTQYNSSTPGHVNFL